LQNLIDFWKIMKKADDFSSSASSI
jgi:hypothetical protein